MKEGFGKDLLICIRMILTVVIVSLFGMIFCQSNDELFIRLVWIFIIFSIVFIGLMIKLTIHILKGNEVDEDLPSQKPY